MSILLKFVYVLLVFLEKSSIGTQVRSKNYGENASHGLSASFLSCLILAEALVYIGSPSRQSLETQ